MKAVTLIKSSLTRNYYPELITDILESREDTRMEYNPRNFAMLQLYIEM